MSDEKVQWYYVLHGQRQGPVDADGIRKLLRDGTLPTESFVWNKSMGATWVKVSTVPELHSATLKLKTHAKSEDPNAQHRMQQAVEYANVIESQKQHRRLWGYSCPNCGDRVHRPVNEDASRWAGLVGAFASMAFASFECGRCGTIERKEFPVSDRVRMLMGSIVLLALALGLLVLVIWLSREYGN